MRTATVSSTLARFAALGVLALAQTAAIDPAVAEPASRVYLNGVATPVYFNDGDSFRVLAGELAGTRARLAGFNTLETYGPVHQWGNWTAKELYFISKMATLNAARGVWSCTSEMEQDVYGRILWHCPDLAVDQIKRGLAHAMTVTAEPADPRFLAAQKDAIENRRGMWAHGVPGFVLTSLHSITEGGGRDGKTYNRLVSTRDGHSAKWQHTDAYEECSTVCREERPIDEETLISAAKHLRQDPEVGHLIAEWPKERVVQVTSDYAQLGYFIGVEDDVARVIERKLAEMDEQGLLGDAAPVQGSCVTFVLFERRYGPNRPDCLR